MSPPPGGARFWCERAWLPGGVADRVLVDCSPGGVVTSVVSGLAAAPDAARLTGLVFPGFANGHSHAFHRALRGRTHESGGTFWTWREAMYRLAGVLDPPRHRRLARLVFAEMVLAGYVAVGEFHYLHHRPGGGRYADPNAMGMALIEAARDAGIRIALLDTCYLTGGLDTDGYRPLAAEQARFGDGDVDGWLNRVAALDVAEGVQRNAGNPGAGVHRDADVAGDGDQWEAGEVRADLSWGTPAAPAHVPRDVRGGVQRNAPPGRPWHIDDVRIGAAVHSVRAVPAAALSTIAAATRDRPVHVHLSEQPAENEACLAFHGRTPAELLADAGLLAPNFTAVHATHLTPSDIALLGGAGVTACICPSTEADLADGIGPARELADAGSPISLGSDQHAVIDALGEIRALEHGERLRTGLRGRFTPAELVDIGTVHGHRGLGWPGAGRIAPGAPCDLVAVRTDSARTAGAAPEQLMLAAGGADVHEVVVGGRTVVRDGLHQRFGAVGPELAEVIEELWRA